MDVRGAIDKSLVNYHSNNLFSIFQAYATELFWKRCLCSPRFVGLDKTAGNVLFGFFWSSFYSNLRQRFSNISSLLVMQY